MLFCRQKSSIIFNLFDNQPCKPFWRLAGSIVPVLHRSVWRSQQLCHPLYCQASGFTCRLYLVFFHADHLHMIYPPYTSPDMKNSAHLLLTSSNVKKKRSTNNRSMAKSPGYIFFIVKPPQILYNLSRQGGFRPPACPVIIYAFACGACVLMAFSFCLSRLSLSV